MSTDLSIFAGDWSGALCIGRTEFCPDEDLMAEPRWAKEIAPGLAQECLGCPRFDQCEESLLAQLGNPDISPTGIMAGVTLVQKSGAQILSALNKVKDRRADYLGVSEPVETSSLPAHLR